MAPERRRSVGAPVALMAMRISSDHRDASGVSSRSTQTSLSHAQGAVQAFDELSIPSGVRDKRVRHSASLLVARQRSNGHRAQLWDKPSTERTSSRASTVPQ